MTSWTTVLVFEVAETVNDGAWDLPWGIIGTLGGAVIGGVIAWLTNRASLKAQKELFAEEIAHQRETLVAQHRQQADFLSAQLEHQTAESNLGLARQVYADYLAVVGELTTFDRRAAFAEAAHKITHPTNAFPPWRLSYSMSTEAPAKKEVYFWQSDLHILWERWLQARGRLMLAANEEVRTIEAKVAGILGRDIPNVLYGKLRRSSMLRDSPEKVEQLRRAMQFHVGIDISAEVEQLDEEIQHQAEVLAETERLEGQKKNATSADQASQGEDPDPARP